MTHVEFTVSKNDLIDVLMVFMFVLLGGGVLTAKF